MAVFQNSISQGICGLFPAVDALVDKSFLKLGTNVSRGWLDQGWGKLFTHMTSVAINQNDDIGIVVLGVSARESCHIFP